MSTAATEPHVFELLERVIAALRTEMQGRQAAIDHAGPPLRPSQYRLLNLVPTEGVRVSELAGTAGMTPQSLGEFARELEGLGMVELTPDARDRRARLIRLTEAGRDAAAASEAAVRSMERVWRRRFGTETWESLRHGLIEVGGVREPRG